VQPVNKNHRNHQGFRRLKSWPDVAGALANTPGSQGVLNKRRMMMILCCLFDQSQKKENKAKIFLT